jgi:hypothetical protein
LPEQVRLELWDFDRFDADDKMCALWFNGPS